MLVAIIFDSEIVDKESTLLQTVHCTSFCCSTFSFDVAERDPLHQGIIVQRATLKAREQQIDLAANLHRTQVSSVAAPLSQQAGYYCDVCDCVLKDSLAYLDHINGKWHNRALGMSMRVEKSTADQVRKRLEEAKKRRRGEAIVEDARDVDHVPDGMNRTALLTEAAHAGTEEESDEEDAAADGGAANVQQLVVQEQEEDDENPDDEDSMDPDLAAMMGFGGFGGGKKS